MVQSRDSPSHTWLVSVDTSLTKSDPAIGAESLAAFTASSALSSVEIQERIAPAERKCLVKARVSMPSMPMILCSLKYSGNDWRERQFDAIGESSPMTRPLT